MLDKDKDRSPAKAAKRAVADFRCAARKLGQDTALDLLVELFPGLDAYLIHTDDGDPS
jgi:hypothetical protein